MGQQILTPIGIAHYPYISKPYVHVPTTKIPDIKTHYKVDIELTNEEAKPIIKVIKEELKLGMLELKQEQPKLKFDRINLPYKDHVDEDGNSTGSVLIKFKSTIDYKPAVFDSENKLMMESNIYAGSEIIVSGYTAFYHTALLGAGVVLRVKAVQILKYVRGPNDEEGYGFVEQDGFKLSNAQIEEGTQEGSEVVEDSGGNDTSFINQLFSDVDDPENTDNFSEPEAKPKAKKKAAKKSAKKQAEKASEVVEEAEDSSFSDDILKFLEEGDEDD